MNGIFEIRLQHQHLLAKTVQGSGEIDIFQCRDILIFTQELQQMRRLPMHRFVSLLQFQKIRITANDTIFLIVVPLPETTFAMRILQQIALVRGLTADQSHVERITPVDVADECLIENLYRPLDLIRRRVFVNQVRRFYDFLRH